jgi:hypothetical protein
MIYEGSCHCGKTAFEVEGELTGVMACNCSICQRKGSLMWFVPREKLQLQTDASAMSTYQFNTHRISHHFCPNCGIHPFGEAVDSKGNHMAAINVRCLENVDLNALPVQHFDGRAL